MMILPGATTGSTTAAAATTRITMSVKRVITCFILSSSSSNNVTTTNDTAATKGAATASSLLTRENLLVAVFKRKETMPTFPSHWAGISGSIEKNEEPWETAVRELQEETNLIPINIENAHATTFEGARASGDADVDDRTIPCIFDNMGGLYLDVPFKPNRNIRVYPFVVHLLPPEGEGDDKLLELRGTEHDTYKFITIQELEQQLTPTVPGLVTAFHHATHGKFLPPDALPPALWKWSEDRVNGATTLAKRSIHLLLEQEESQQHPNTFHDWLSTMTFLRPTMVPIVNVLREMQQRLSLLKEQESEQQRQVVGQEILSSIEEQLEQSIELSLQALEILQQKRQQVCERQPHPSSSAVVFTIATFSRSSTIVKLLQRFLEKQQQQQHRAIRILCAKSTPGDEGILMAEDIRQFITTTSPTASTVTVECIEDDELHQSILRNDDDLNVGVVDVVLVGCDCLLPNQIVNKIGTKALAETCQRSPATTIICCGDIWKIWNDDFPPPLEDIFECVPRQLLDQVICPPNPQKGEEEGRGEERSSPDVTT